MVSRQAMAKVTTYDQLVALIEKPKEVAKPKLKVQAGGSEFAALRAALSRYSTGFKVKSTRSEYALIRVRQQQGVPVVTIQQQRGGAVKMRLFLLKHYRRLNALVTKSLAEHQLKEKHSFLFKTVTAAGLKSLKAIVARGARLTRANAITD